MKYFLIISSPPPDSCLQKDTSGVELGILLFYTEFNWRVDSEQSILQMNTIGPAIRLASKLSLVSDILKFKMSTYLGSSSTSAPEI